MAKNDQSVAIHLDHVENYSEAYGQHSIPGEKVGLEIDQGDGAVLFDIGFRSTEAGGGTTSLKLARDGHVSSDRCSFLCSKFAIADY